MATFDYKKLTGNHLTCAICTTVFTDPATLQCNHTFCKACLLKYIKTHPEAIQDKSIQCPSCRQLTKLTTPDRPVEEWVSQLKPSHVIQGLMDDFLPAMHEVQDDSGCNICTTQGKTSPACSWCSICDCAFCDGCLKMHSVMPMSRDHEVADLPNHPKTNRSFMCNIHRDEKLKVFCKDCRKAICTVCCSIDHRKCDEVDTIESMVPIVKEQLTNQMKQLTVNMAAAKKCIDLRKDTILDMKSNAQNIKDQIRNAGKTLVDVIVKKEKHLIDDVDEFCHNHSQKLQSEVAHQEDELQLYQQQYETTASAVTSNCEMDMFAIYESMDEATDHRQMDNPPAPGRVVFTHNIDKLSKEVDELRLGEVEVVHDISDRHSSPVLHHSIDFKDDEDNCDPSLHDVTVVMVNGIKVTIVADCGNNKLKTYYTLNSKSFHKHLLFSDYPWQIAKLSGSQVAVTIPDINEIVTVDITPDPIVLSTLNTSKQYCALAYLSPSQLVAGTYADNVDILDMAGNVLQSFNTGLIGSPDFIHVTSDKNLILSNEDVHSLVSLTSEGDPVFTYTPTGDRTLTCPQGIATTTTGDILLVDETSNNVTQLSESMQFVRYVLQGQDGLHCPDGICLDDDGLLYVTSNRYVKVYTFRVHSNT
ncbi:E3 ubiquitin-protein ligase Midline-1-like [Haliotis rubra]|uniref:E3 ubiquitin-protein ligase Midline-1-like n=1 Tax=Haliotis rubra TaxID=36100 RepID=UPI001EE5545C|nr:E3 ubiquitin-protein ligase Midline-1-like [Haliotis rubra]